MSEIEPTTRIQQLERSLRLLSACNRTLVRATSEENLLENLCQNLVEVGGYRLAWVGYVQHDDVKTVQPIAYAGHEAGYLTTAQITWADTERDRWPTGKAIRSGKVCLVQDMQTEPTDTPWQDEAWQRGYRAAITIPLINHEHEVFGVMNIYAAEANVFRAVEVDLLIHLCHDLSYGIRALRMERDRIEAEQAKTQLLTEVMASRTETTQARDLLASVYERMHDGIVALDTQWRYVYINKQAAEFLGRPAADLIGKHIWTEFPEGIDQPFYRAYYRAVEQQTPIFLEEYYEPWQRWFENRIYPDQNGLTIYFTDVSDRKQAEIKLAASEDRLRTIIDTEPECVKILAADGTILDSNPAGLDILEADSLSQVVGCSILSWLPPTYHPAFTDLSDRIFRGETVQLEFVIQGLRGAHRWVEAHAAPLRNPQNEIVSILAISRDVTKRKQAELALRESQAQFSHLASNLPGMIYQYVLHADGSDAFTYVSAGCRDIYELEPDDLLADFSQVWAMIHPEDVERVSQVNRNSAQDLERFDVEFRLRPPSGGVRWVRAISQPERQDNGDVIWDGFVLDISDTVQLEAERRHAELEHLRTEQMRQLNEELQRSNQDLEQFASIISHDLQEPLRAITGFTQLLAQQYASVLSEPDAQDYIGFITEGAQRLRSQIQDLLTYSQVGSRQLNLALTDCNDVLAEVSSNLAVAIAQSQAVITADPLPTLWVDRSQFVQVLQNLISNAIKFRREEPPQIQISATQYWPSDLNQPQQLDRERTSDWIFSIQDHGIGIQPQFLERVFDVFRRLHPQHQFPGTGIGLAICKKSIERHGGHIWMESQLGIGTTVYFTLPDQSTGDERH
jgi:PAS domain S-box-containing protein